MYDFLNKPKCPMFMHTQQLISYRYINHQIECKMRERNMQKFTMEIAI